MFYAHFVLSKKGPLARIWLAAHWDKKLSKAHVFETDVEDCCDSIIHPKVKMALRTTGHLLLGVVRIHSRKAKYLLADCNEAFVKIKMAFRPGVVDLPEENREAAFAAITLPEVFHDFDTAMPEINDAEVQKQFTLNQSRVEEITMKEDLGNITLGHDDGFGMGDLGFDHSVMRDAGSGEDSLYKHGGHDSTLLEVSKKGSAIDTSLEKQMDIDLDQPIRYDGFGGQIGTSDPLIGDGFMTGASDLFDEHPEIPAGEIQLRPEDAMSTTSSTGKKDDEDKEREATIAEVESQESSANKASNEENSEQQSNAPVDQTTLVANEEEAFALEPLDVTGVKEIRHRRKRKLIVDEVKELAGDIIKAQLKDTSDIVTTLDLAPPTKKLMLWKETGGAEKLFVLPGRLHASEIILRSYTKNLTAETPKDLPKNIPSDPMEIEETHIPRQKRKHSEIDVAPRESLLPAEHIIETPQPPEEQQQPEEPTTSNVEDFTQARRPSSDDDDGGFDFGGYEDDDDDDDDVPAFVPSALPPVQIVDEPVVEEEESSDEEENDDETTEARTERKLNKRATQMLNTIKRQFEKEEYAYFGDLVRNNNRKQVAAKFYSLLVLKKQQDICVEQIEPFADIRISRGPATQVVF
ncbi:double-strand-break repair protein rad21 homolog [Anneissia japonica]|uniref:double-strand-break repair protein rad21 homolog n=1 Tax=Anneissia japonica TaxID=1529436 RepID=UPI0014255114|nr:double-strand-break repair protein rad21 homolog [Anneissia japonica]XP_033126898.1 double-strand-break repair protein rad21 homolog [Anneissia japonica]